jgi:hypothetical protein
MSAEIEKLLGRAVLDKDFRDQLMADPENAVARAGFKLPDDELEALKQGLKKVEYDAPQFDSQFGALARWK